MSVSHKPPGPIRLCEICEFVMDAPVRTKDDYDVLSEGESSSASSSHHQWPWGGVRYGYIQDGSSLKLYCLKGPLPGNGPSEMSGANGAPAVSQISRSPPIGDRRAEGRPCMPNA
jgi:hypothetical protein